MSNVINKLKGIEIGGYVRTIALLLIIAIVSIINPNFLSAYNVNALMEDIGVLLIMSIGVSFILLIGAMDLSLGSNVSCCAVTIAMLIPRFGVFSFVIAIMFGVGIGLFNGICFTRLRIPSFIVTLGSMSIFTSIAMLISGSKSVSIGKPYYGLIKWVKFDLGVFPIAFLISIILLVVFVFVQKYTAFGRTCYLVGANERAAMIGGCNVAKCKVIAFMVSGLCYALASIVMVARLKSANPNVGDNYTMMSIAAVAFGGTALSGGRGGALPTLLGAAMIVIITNALVLLSVDIYWQKIVYGVIIIIALCTTVNKADKNLVIK